MDGSLSSAPQCLDNDFIREAPRTTTSLGKHLAHRSHTVLRHPWVPRRPAHLNNPVRSSLLLALHINHLPLVLDLFVRLLHAPRVELTSVILARIVRCKRLPSIRLISWYSSCLGRSSPSARSMSGPRSRKRLLASAHPLVCRSWARSKGATVPVYVEFASFLPLPCQRAVYLLGHG